MTEPRQAVLYRRVSTLRQAEEGMSLAAQDHSLRQYCEQRGWTVLKECIDAGKSGRSRAKRPGLNAALNAVKESGGVLVVYSLSRLARSVADAGAILGELRAAKADLAVVDMALDTSTAAGELIFHVISAVAQFESQLIGQRVQAINKHIISERGYRTMGRQAYGWTINDQGDRVEVPEEQAIIAEVKAFVAEQTVLRKQLSELRRKHRRAKSEWRRAELRPQIAALTATRLTPAMQADHLNQRGIKTPRGQAWTPAILAEFMRRHGR